MKTKIYISCVLGLSYLCGCASSNFTLKSDPVDAEVYFVLNSPTAASPGAETASADAKSAAQNDKADAKKDSKAESKADASANLANRKLLGKAPLVMPMSDLKAALGNNVTNGEYFTLVIEKPGYQSETLQVPATRFGTMVENLSVHLNKVDPLVEDKKKKEKDEQAQNAADILNHLYLAQKFALAQQFERAQIELDKILSPFPNFARALSMRASIYYAQKNPSESLKWYEEALKADPQMEDVVKMVAKIRAGGDGLRLPASSPNQTGQRSGTKKGTSP